MKKFSSFIILFLSFQAMSMEQVDFSKAKWSIYIDELQSAQNKQEQLWGMISKKPYGTNLPDLTGPGLYGIMDLMSPEFDAKAFSNNGDTLEPARSKRIHTWGTSIKITFIPDSKSPFTGIFASKTLGIFRLSLAEPPSLGGLFSSDNVKPGIAIKFLVDTEPSVNTFAMYSLDGQESANLFENRFTNVLPAPAWSPKTAVLECRFAQALELLGQDNGNPRELSSDHMARVTPDGKVVDIAHAPYEIIFRPTKDANLLFNNTSMKDDFRTVLENKGFGIILYEVWARQFKNDVDTIKIGFIETSSNFVASEFGDNLYFKHHRTHDND